MGVIMSDSDLIKIFGSVMSIVMGAGVIGLWRMSNMVAAMQATVQSWGILFEKVSEEQKSHGERIAHLEASAKINRFLIDKQYHPLHVVTDDE